MSRPAHRRATTVRAHATNMPASCRECIEKDSTCCCRSAAYRDDAVLGFAATRSLNADWTERHHTAAVEVPCLPSASTNVCGAFTPHFG